ncbi:nuclear receptor interacting protein 1 S homeolog [Xenopus laevis]|uniref:MGC68665 protein n=1 Tax=Xenopus laevis TaxID=8355 RepID=Q6P429_XENLA|nr:nuclear receptor interacting protein 1 S homeolog [Xenopus laevis]AAH63719.1 MGC68665 protein [Xenopus laevis]
MTYGEELSSEMQQDSVVLTYLEGLLMHQAAGGSGTAVDKLSVSRAKSNDNFKNSGNIFSNCESNVPLRNNSSPCQGSGMLHLKKARLLQSSEDWNASKRRRLSDSIPGINGKNETFLAGMVANAPKGKQDSTLLASLLQSFSSRLQNVALSQQLKQSLKEQGFSLSPETVQEEKNNQCVGMASSHLKTLLNKNRSKEKITDSNKTTKASIQGKYTESSHSGQSSTKGVAAEPISCAARLQAVACMVEKRSSPTVSPKPSVACSQLALLLSSEAHLQQYSREHAVKAQSANQLASERLAAMARLKETSEKDLGHFPLSTSLPTALNSPARTTISNGIGNIGNISPFSSPLSVPHSPHKSVGYKNHSEKNHLKPSPNNSLLLHLLKSQNATNVNKCNLQSDKIPAFEESATPTTTDDFSDNNPSFTEDETSDDESSHSNCAPIDLSFKNRVDKPEVLNTASIDNLTESLLKNWDPKVEGLDINKHNNRESSLVSTLKPHQKVTLLQLLLGHKADENPEKMEDLQAPQTKFSLPIQRHVSENTHVHNSALLNALPVNHCSKSDSPVNLTQAFSPKNTYTSYISSIQSERHTNAASKHLIELTRKKSFHNPIPLINESAPNNAAFSASKLLQNLAQCGKQTPAPDEQIAQKPVSAPNGKTLGLIDRLNSPLMTNQSHTFEVEKSFSSPPTPTDSTFPGSEIENLLERRTVLQLLLGTPNKGKLEKNPNITIKDENQQDRVEKKTSEQIVAFKIKTEPEDSYSTQHLRDTEIPSPLAMSIHSFSRSPSEGMKSPNLTPHEFSVSRNGLLSHLLTQNHNGYEISDPAKTNRNSGPRQTETKTPCTVPKKRKMHQNEHVESQVKFAKLSPSESGQYCSSPSLSGPMFHQNGMQSNKSDYPRCNVSQNSFNEGKHLGWSRESKGFNVLKQLLLSENCVRDLSQHRNNVSVDDMVKWNRSHVAGSSDFVTPSLNVHMGKMSNHTNSLGQMPFQCPSSFKSSPHSPSDSLIHKTSRTESGQINMAPISNDKGPIKWVITGMEKDDVAKDSPRLTKTNPILYYMLQKGAHSAGSQELRDRDSWTESLLGNASEVAFRREMVNCRGTTPNGSVVTKTTTPVVNKTWHNSNGNKYGLFDILTIKKEPE